MTVHTLRRRFGTVAGLALLLLLLTACPTSTPPPSGETLASFDVSVPASAQEGASFTLTVTAVGSQGTEPFTSFEGTVALAASTGTLSPSSLTLADGTGTVDATVTGADGNVTITASSGGVSGSATLVIGDDPPTTSLPGDPGDPAAEAITQSRWEPRPDDYQADHPELGDTYVSTNTLLLAFTLETTVAQANALLAEIDAEIIAGQPGVAGEAAGILALRVPTTTHQEMTALIATLQADARVQYAVQDALLETMRIPQPNGGSPATWTWESTPTGGNYGLELIRAPQMWNLNSAILKAGRTSVTAVLDAGFADSHPDLSYLDNQTPGNPNDHGTHVVGTIGATFDNGVGVDGVNPYADLVVRTRDSSGFGGSTTLAVRESWGDSHIFGLFDLLQSRNDIRTINVSLGYNWGRGGVDQDNSTSAQQLVEQQGSLLGLGLLLTVLFDNDYDSFAELPLIAVAAGNDSNSGFGTQQARWASAYTYAALEFDLDNIVVVESVANAPASAGGGTRSNFSNIGGHLSAPGTGIWSTITGNSYGSMNGTSMATPHVTGLIGYLAALDPTLEPADIRDILAQTSVAVAGGASARIDAFAAAMDIDRVNGDSAVLQMLLDIDDGTPDGNQRLLVGTSTDFTGEDADGDGGIGDGNIDMADFRRWRDWLLQTENPAGLDLDGSSTHPKKDVNGNGTVQGPAAENVYPRGDFNGDGQLSRSATSFVPGAIDATATDLAVLRDQFTGDTNYSESSLPGLIDSADIEVWPRRCLNRPDVASVTSAVFLEGGGDLPNYLHTHTGASPRYVYTVPESAEGPTVLIEARDADDNVVFETTVFVLFELGSDTLLDPECGGAPEPPAGEIGTSWGDPHLITFDGLKYDFQAVGEFLFLKSEYTVTIQVRQEPWGASNRVSVNTAVAIDADGHRVGLYADASPPLFVDGTQTPLADGASLPLGDAQVYRNGNVYTIVDDTSHQTIVTMRSGRMDIDVALPDNPSGAIEGLLGDADGNRENDIALRNGTVLSTPIPFDELYGTFADSWRISQTESLFDYDPGENTSTFTDLNFPSSYASTGDLTPAQYESAKGFCENAGITDPIVLEACILDVGLTGDNGFAEDSGDAPNARASLDVTPETRTAALIYGSDDSAATAYETALEARGFDVTLLFVGSTEAGNASTLQPYDLIVIDTLSGDATNPPTWQGNSKTINAIEQSGNPILGVGQGGAAYFELAGGSQFTSSGSWYATGTKFDETSPIHPSLTGPRNVASSGGSVTVATSSTGFLAVYLPQPGSSIELVGRQSGDPNHYPVVLDNARDEAFWGFYATPTGQFTADAFDALANLANYLIDLP